MNLESPDADWHAVCAPKIQNVKAAGWTGAGAPRGVKTGKCSLSNGLEGCWECAERECRKGLFASKIKVLGFTEYVRRYGMEALLDRLEANEKAGIVYHREGIMGDYDEFDDLETLIAFINTGKR